MSTISSLGVGSGLDLSGLLDQLRDAERGKLQPIERQRAQQQAKISAFGQLQSSLTSFRDKVATLNSASLFQSLSANVGGDAFKATTSKAAMPGSYSIEVNQLSRAGNLATQRVSAADTAIVGGADQTLTLTFANANTVDVDIAAGSSLEDIRDAINAKGNAGVSASIINDGNGYRLALSSTASGADASIASTNFMDILNQDSVDEITADATNQTAFQPGQDAELNINGIAITSPTNRVEGAIQGVTLNLQSVTAENQPISMKVEQDTLRVREAINGFVKAFNDLKGTMGSLTSFNAETGEAGDLNGDGAVRTIDARLRGALTGGVGEGEMRMLSDIGIRLQRDGTLKVDDERLNELVSGDMAGLGAFFAGNNQAGGLAGALSSTLGQLLDDNGVLKSSISSAEGRVSSLNDRYSRMEQTIERTIARYRTQFGQLDSMIARMNQTSDYLTQQFDNMNAQLGRR